MTDTSGCVFEGSTSRTADELNVAVIMLAERAGFPAAKLTEALLTSDAWEDRWLAEADLAQLVSEAAQNAADYLTEQCAPVGHCFMFDGRFYRYPVDDDVEPYYWGWIHR